MQRYGGKVSYREFIRASVVYRFKVFEEFEVFEVLWNR